MDKFSNCWELVHWHFCSMLVLQIILVALDPRMVRVRKCVCLVDPRTVRVRNKICGSGSADIRVRSPHTSGLQRLAWHCMAHDRTRITFLTPATKPSAVLLSGGYCRGARWISAVCGHVNCLLWSDWLTVQSLGRIQWLPLKPGSCFIVSDVVVQSQYICNANRRLSIQELRLNFHISKQYLEIPPAPHRDSQKTTLRLEVRR